MANVKLRTIINEDNSTTFQVQFEDGKWVDLTWDMISNKPFETLDNTVFIVDENGVLTITDTPINWSDIGDKPFITLNPDDFEVSPSGVLSYKGSIDWADILGKPFNSLNDNDFDTQNGVLSVKHQPIPNQTWQQIQQKPFNSLDPTTFQVVGGVLYLNTNPGITYWNDIENKPFSFIDNNTLEVVDDTLKAKAPTIPNQTWSQIEQKPFSTLNPTDFSVNEGGEVSVNFPEAPTTTINWQDVQNKPFSSIQNPMLYVNNDELICSPSINLNYEMGTSTIGINNGSMDLQNFPFWYIKNSFVQRFGSGSGQLVPYQIASDPQGWFGAIDDNRECCARLKLKINNTKSGLTQWNAYYWITIKMKGIRIGSDGTNGIYLIFLDIEHYPLYSDTTGQKFIHIFGSLRWKVSEAETPNVPQSRPMDYNLSYVIEDGSYTMNG